MRVLIAHRQTSAEHRFLVEILRTRGEHQVLTLDEGQAFLEGACQEPAPDVIFIDGRSTQPSALEACRAAERDAALAPYVLVSVPRRTPAALEQYLRAGAADALALPLCPDLVLAHLRVAAARREQRSGASSSRLAPALLAAAREGSGELVLRGGTRSARIYFHESRIAWIHVPDAPLSLADLLPADAAIDEGMASAVLEECRARGEALGETLVRWGLVGREQLSTSLRQWFRDRLQMIQQYTELTSLFIPQQFEYTDELSFPPEELLDDEAFATRSETMSLSSASGLPLPAQRSWTDAFFSTLEPDETARGLLVDCAQMQGVQGLAVLDRSSGACICRSGADLDPDIAWSFLTTLAAARDGAPPADIAATLGGHHHLVRTLPESDFAVYAVFHGARTRLATAQIELRLILDRRIAALIGRTNLEGHPNASPRR